ncbi:cell division protein FtsX [Patescibacteria group bacterium]
MKNHFKTAFGYIRRSPFQAMAAIFVLTLTFFVGTLVSTLVYSSSKVLTHFETRPQVIAFLKDEVDSEQVAQLQHKLSSDVKIKEVRYVSKEEALSIYKRATSDNPLLGELVSPSIFPASLEFSVVDLTFAQEVIDQVKKEEVVDSVGFTAALGGESNLQDVIGRLKTVTWYIRLGGAAFAGVLMATSFIILMIIISMRMVGRRQEVEILDLIGATPGFIRSPIVLEALIYAACGVFLGWILAFTLILYTAPNLISYFGEIPILPKDTMSVLILFGAILVVEIFFGFALALWGSNLAVTRVRRNK